MSDKAKVVLTDYVWEKLDVENEILGALADVVPLQVTDPDAFFPGFGEKLLKASFLEKVDP